ncbi:Rne/Rng family ribonuclease [Desulforhopalus vacuolatus]|uniref:Rne/Rng family ribonuclease n=1 Tax=Desulforhopalus vacuolatus TaxID=40414 RepID=UPI00196291A1|nr:Rne/Rng family ribonuclease [Desulforhopalus vacuolatus]MBM9519947.1 Rne/Rng family ribonuclease [Desulforhopalus vacuolatus]
MSEGTDKKKPKKSIKATTGAWWKSTSSVESSEPVEKKKRPEKKEKAAVKPAAEPVKTEAATDAAVEKKPVRKRSSRRRSSSRKKTETDSVATIGEDGDSPAAAEKEKSDSVEVLAEKPAKTASRSRSRRPSSRRGRKPAAAKENAADATSSSDQKTVAVPSPVEIPLEEDKGSPSVSVTGLDTSAADKTLAKVTNALEVADPEIADAEEVLPPVELSSSADDSTEKEKSAQPESGQAHSRRGRKNGRGTKKTNTEEGNVESSPPEGKEKSGDKAEPRKSMKLLINAEEPEECRLALLEDGRLESIHVSTVFRTQRKSNIYKAKVVAIEPSLQAAFVDYGTEKNGFLPFSEIHPEYFKVNLSDDVREKVEKQQWKKLSITDVLERGQELLAQVVKEEIGRKGANMTTFLSIPGRCVVLMPGSDSAGISRKISGEQRRGQLRDIMKSFDIPEGTGWIVRTASSEITESALSRDTDYLLKLWKDIRERGQALKGVGLLYEDHQTVARFLREHFDPAIEEILVDDRTALEQVKDFVAMQPKVQQKVRVRLHQGARPIFNMYSVEEQIEQIYQPQVNLPSGGSIVIDPTEALVAIDVNSGSTSKGANFEESIFQANMEAATELARQLRLRDLGGLVVVDFIDMRSRKHILAVEKQVKQAMKSDKAKVDFSKISKFGLMEISRQKLGAPIESGNYRVCEYCKGRGTMRSVETLSLFYLRRIQTGASRNPVERVECNFPLDVASYLLNHKRAELIEMEKRQQVKIDIIGHSNMKPADNEIIFRKKENEAHGREK